MWCRCGFMYTIDWCMCFHVVLPENQQLLHACRSCCTNLRCTLVRRFLCMGSWNSLSDNVLCFLNSYLSVLHFRPCEVCNRSTMAAVPDAWSLHTPCITACMNALIKTLRHCLEALELKIGQCQFYEGAGRDWSPPPPPSTEPPLHVVNNQILKTLLVSTTESV